jgi:hypothetical protein
MSTSFTQTRFEKFLSPVVSIQSAELKKALIEGRRLYEKDVEVVIKSCSFKSIKSTQPEAKLAHYRNAGGALSVNFVNLGKVEISKTVFYDCQSNYQCGGAFIYTNFVDIRNVCFEKCLSTARSGQAAWIYSNLANAKANGNVFQLNNIFVSECGSATEGRHSIISIGAEGSTKDGSILINGLNSTKNQVPNGNGAGVEFYSNTDSAVSLITVGTFSYCNFFNNKGKTICTLIEASQVDQPRYIYIKTTTFDNNDASGANLYLISRYQTIVRVEDSILLVGADDKLAKFTGIEKTNSVFLFKNFKLDKKPKLGYVKYNGENQNGLTIPPSSPFGDAERDQVCRFHEHGTAHFDPTKTFTLSYFFTPSNQFSSSVTLKPKPTPVEPDPTPTPAAEEEGQDPVPPAADPTPIPPAADPTPIPPAADPTPVPPAADPTPIPPAADPTTTPAAEEGGQEPAPPAADPTPTPSKTFTHDMFLVRPGPQENLYLPRAGITPVPANKRKISPETIAFLTLLNLL